MFLQDWVQLNMIQHMIPVASVTTLVIVMGESAIDVMVRPAKKITCYLTSVDFK